MNCWLKALWRPGGSIPTEARDRCDLKGGTRKG
jgi:hypothetical protein